MTNRIIYSSYSPWRFNVTKAEGSYLWAGDQKLIDFSSGWNVANLGWNHPEINDAVAEQASRNTYVPMWSSDDLQQSYAEQLTDALPEGLDFVARATGGTEANEAAFKMARAHTSRSKIVSIRDSYHGQSFGSLAAGQRPEYVKDIAPVVPEFVQIEYPSSDRDISMDEFKQHLEDALKGEDVAAVLTEAGIITGWGSTSVAPDGYTTFVREITEKYGTLMILDEVGTGFSRCGALFGLELEGVVPDIVTFAKGISNGAGVIGAAVVTEEIAKSSHGGAQLTSTFGWAPIAVAAAQKTLEIHQRDKVWEKAKADGEYLVTALKKKLVDASGVEDVRGKGMEIGIQLAESNARDVVRAAQKQGLHITDADDNALQIMPPLTIERAVLDEGTDLLVSAIEGA